MKASTSQNYLSLLYFFLRWIFQKNQQLSLSSRKNPWIILTVKEVVRANTTNSKEWCVKASPPCHTKQSPWPSQPFGGDGGVYIPTLITSLGVQGRDKANKWLVITAVITSGAVIRGAIRPIWTSSSRAMDLSLIVPEWLIVSGSAAANRPCPCEAYPQSLAAHWPCLQATIKGPPVLWVTATNEFPCVLRSSADRWPLASRKQAVSGPAPGLDIMVRAAGARRVLRHICQANTGMRC